MPHHEDNEEPELDCPHCGRGVFFIRQGPLRYSSPNAPTEQDILGTVLLGVLLGVLAGHKRYAHTTIRSDSVLPELLEVKRVRSEDAVRRAFHACACSRSLRG